MSPNVSIPAAFLAGLVSFLSPCVLPLVPPYLCYLAGTTLDELQSGSATRRRRDAVASSMAFVGGFTTVFVALGATASVFGQLIRRFDTVLSLAAGIAIIVMGLHFLGLFRLALLYREKRVRVERSAGLGPAYVMGLAFAFGWTPCIGPILAAILAIAGSEASVGHGTLLLAVYSAGLGLPFVAAAFMVGGFMRFSRAFRRYFPVVERVAGGLLVLTGIAFLTGGMQSLSLWLIQTFPDLASLG